MLQIPLVYPRFTDKRPVSAFTCHCLENKDADSKGNEISESGWTTYLDQSVDRQCNKKPWEFDIYPQDREASERYPTYYHSASSFTSNEKESSLTSDASSGPQKLPLTLPVQDIGFGRQGAGSYSSVSSRKQDVHADNREDFECVTSCLSADVNPRKNKFRKLNENEHAELLLQDTASSSFRHSPDIGLVQNDVNIEQNMQLQAGSFVDIEGEGENARLEQLQFLFLDGGNIRVEEVVGVLIEYKFPGTNNSGYAI